MNFLAVLLIQIFVYLLIFLADDYIGTLMSLILGSICFCVWAISLMVEWISPSKVKRDYYRYVLAGWIGPLFAFIAFAMAKGGFDWLK